MSDSEVPEDWYNQGKNELPTVAQVVRDRRKGGLKLTGIAYSAFEVGDKLVRPQDILQRIEELEEDEIRQHGHKRKVQEHAFDRLKEELREKTGIEKKTDAVEQ